MERDRQSGVSSPKASKRYFKSVPVSILFFGTASFLIVAFLIFTFFLQPPLIPLSDSLSHRGQAFDGELGTLVNASCNEIRTNLPTFNISTYTPTLDNLVPLPPGVSEDTDACWSRQERHFYLKGIMHKPAERLVQALREYEGYHGRCTAGVNDWSARLGGDSGKTDGCKYVVYLRGAGGMGNRLLSLASAFVYALLTDRVLLVDTWSLNFHTLFCNPFAPSPFFVQLSALHRVKRLGDFLKGGGVGQDAALVYLEWDSNEGDSIFYCAETQSKIANVTWLGFNSDTYSLVLMHLIPGFDKKMGELFPDHVILFHVLHYLLHPANVLWERIRNIHRSYLERSDKLIGLQIRTFAQYDPEVDPRIVQCLTEHGSMPPLMPEDQHLAIHGMRFYSRVRKFLNHSPRTYVTVLVTSLDAKYYESLKRTYTEHATVDGSVVRVHMESKDGAELVSLDQDQKAIVEMWLLGFSDELFVSHTSTFGYIAVALGGKGGTSMNIIDRQRDLGWGWRGGGAVCEKVSVEPCQQVTGPRVTCEADGYHTGTYDDERGKAVNKQFPLYIQRCAGHWNRVGASGLHIRPEGEA